MMRALARRLGLGAVGTLALLAGSAHAQVIVDDAFLFGATYQASEKAFDVATAGPYQFQLVDLLFPQPLLGVSGAVTRGSVKVVSLRTTGVIEFQALAGRHKLLIAPVPRTVGEFGTFGTSVTASAGGAPIVEHSDAAASIAASEPPLQSTWQTGFAIPSAGRYRVTLSDLAFPTALVSLQALIIRADGSTAARLTTADTSADFDTGAGQHTLLVAVDAANSDSAGAYSVTVAGLSGQGTAFATAQGAGRLDTGREVTLPAAGGFTLDLADLQIPRAFATLGAAVAQGGALVARTTTPASVPFVAAAGKATVFLYRKAGGGQLTGTSLVRISSGATRVLDAVDVASPELAAGAESAFAVVVEATTTGLHRATLVDFDFPAPAAQSALYVVQDGRVIGERAGRGSVDVQAVPGTLQAIAVVTPNALSRSSLVNVQLAQATAGTALGEETQAIGIDLQSRTLDLPVSGSYDLTVTDLAFPAQFAELALAVTRGDQRVASVFGSGRVTFTGTAGRHTVNLLGRVGAATEFGAFGLRVEPTPAPPSITLAAAPLEVRRDGVTTLTWSSTGATSCTASDGWSGARATSGSVTSAPLTSDTRFSLTCTGPGGQATARVDVRVKAAAGGGGGGVGSGLLALLTVLACAARARRVVASPA